MKNNIFLGIAIFCICIIADNVSADGPQYNPDAVSLYSDVKAYRVGDVLSIIISESNSATNNSKTSTQKQNSGEIKGDATTGALKGLFPGAGGSLDYTNQYQGQGNTVRSGSLTSRMTVKVVDITPTGGLVIEGTKTMEINDEIEVVVLSGMVRSVDISSSNTVYSYQIANAKFTYKGKGSISTGQRPGLLVRIINWLL